MIKVDNLKKSTFSFIVFIKKAILWEELKVERIETIRQNINYL